MRVRVSIVVVVAAGLLGLASAAPAGPGPPSQLTLGPKSATNVVGTQHCVTATVADSFGTRLSGIVVDFVVSGAHSLSGSGSTNINGQVQACYVGQNVGNDSIRATVRSDPGVFDTASKTWTPQPPVATTLSLAPKTATNTVGAQHCVTATVLDQFGNPMSAVGVNFQVSGANTAQGVQPSNAAGQAQFCYTGQNTGDDTITASSGSLSDTAAKTWTPVVVPPPPKLGKAVNVRTTKGTVLVNTPGPGGFVPLTQLRQIPVGSIIDARLGEIRLISARDRQGQTQTGFFSNAIFKIFQGLRSDGLTTLQLVGGDFSVCETSGQAARGTLSKRIVRKLRARARRGRFRSRGSYVAGTVRGTVWNTTDRCDGSVLQVFRGSVTVRDLVLRKTVIVPAGKGYIARPPEP